MNEHNSDGGNMAYHDETTLIIDGDDVRGVILQNLGSGENLEMVYSGNKRW